MDARAECRPGIHASSVLHHGVDLLAMLLED